MKDIILDQKNPLWPLININDVNGNNLVSVISYNFSTKEIKFYKSQDTDSILTKEMLLLDKKFFSLIKSDENNIPIVYSEIYPNSIVSIIQ